MRDCRGRAQPCARPPPRWHGSAGRGGPRRFTARISPTSSPASSTARSTGSKSCSPRTGNSHPLSSKKPCRLQTQGGSNRADTSELSIMALPADYRCADREIRERGCGGLCDDCVDIYRFCPPAPRSFTAQLTGSSAGQCGHFPISPFACAENTKLLRIHAPRRSEHG